MLSKFTFNETKELGGLPAKIEGIEEQIGQLQGAMAEPDFYKQSGDVIAREQGVLEKLEAELELAMERWELLEGIQSGD